MDTGSTATRSRWTGAVALVLVLLFGALVWWTLCELSSVDRGMVIYRLNTETARLASTLFFDKMTALAQLTVGLLGGAWAFLTLADTRVKVTGWPTVTCFALANLSFVCSLAVYVYGYDFIVARIFHHGSFDVDAPFVSAVNALQQYWFLKGASDLGFMILVGRTIR